MCCMQEVVEVLFDEFCCVVCVLCCVLCYIVCVCVSYDVLCCVVLCAGSGGSAFWQVAGTQETPRKIPSPHFLYHSTTLKDFNRTHNHTEWYLRQNSCGHAWNPRNDFVFFSILVFRLNRKKAFCPDLYLTIQIPSWRVSAMGCRNGQHMLPENPKTVNQPQIAPSPWIPNGKVQKLRNTEILLPLKGHILLVTKSVFLNHL